MFVRGTKGNPAVDAVTETNTQSNAENYTKKSTSADSSAPGMAAAPVSSGQRDPRKKNSGLSHWAARGNLKGWREGRISEERLGLAGHLDTRSLCQRGLQTREKLLRLVPWGQH